MADRDRITGAGRELGGKGQDTSERLYGHAKDAVRHAADEVSDRAADAYDRGRDLAWEGHQTSVEWPHASLLVAGLVGFGLGFLVSKL
jgi:ElaB/YqjD/DUF883 family membrane-anchored ribosome-binding protein